MKSEKRKEESEREKRERERVGEEGRLREREGK